MGVGVTLLSGLKMVFRPRPENVPEKATKGPKLGEGSVASAVSAATAAAAAVVGRSTASTSRIEKLACAVKTSSSGFDGLTIDSPNG